MRLLKFTAILAALCVILACSRPSAQDTSEGVIGQDLQVASAGNLGIAGQKAGPLMEMKMGVSVGWAYLVPTADHTVCVLAIGGTYSNQSDFPLNMIGSTKMLMDSKGRHYQGEKQKNSR